MLPSVYVPVAVNCSGIPAATEGSAGVTAMETSAGAVTVRVVEPETEPEVAEINEVPSLSVEAIPVALMVAVAVVAEAQVTEFVKFCVLPSVYVPMAVNCSGIPATTEGNPGVTAIEFSVAAVTVRVVEPETEPEVAEISEVPSFSVEAMPVALMVGGLFTSCTSASKTMA